MGLKRYLMIGLAALTIAAVPKSPVQDRLIEIEQQIKTEIVQEINSVYPKGNRGYKLQVGTLNDYVLEPTKKKMLSFDFLVSVKREKVLSSKIKETRSYFKKVKDQTLDQLGKVKGCIAKYVDKNDIDDLNQVGKEEVFDCVRSDTKLEDWKVISSNGASALNAYEGLAKVLVGTEYYKRLSSDEKNKLWQSVANGVQNGDNFSGFIEMMGKYNSKNLERIEDVFRGQ